MAEESHENFSNFDPMSAFGLERSEGENQNKPKSKPANETIVWRKTDSARKADLPWSKAKIDLDSSMETLNTSDKKTDFAG